MVGGASERASEPLGDVSLAGLCVRLCVLFAAEEQEVAIKDVVLMIADAIGFQGEIEVRAGCDSAPEWQPTPCAQFDVSKSDGQLKKTASIAKLRGLLPDFKFTPMKEGSPPPPPPLWCRCRLRRGCSGREVVRGALRFRSQVKKLSARVAWLFVENCFSFPRYDILWHWDCGVENALL